MEHQIRSDGVVSTNIRLRRILFLCHRVLLGFQKLNSAKEENACDQKVRLPLKWIIVLVFFLFAIILINEVIEL